MSHAKMDADLHDVYQIEQAAGLYELLTGKPPKQTW